MSYRILVTLLLSASLSPSAGSQDLCSQPVVDAPLVPARVVRGAQELYIAGSSPAPGFNFQVAEFDGAIWSLLPGLFDGDVLALAETSAGLVAGGSFATVDGAPRSGVARFQAGSWVPLGAGISGDVHDLVEHLGELFAVGSFTAAGGGGAANVARWDGVAWHPLGAGLDAPGATVASHQGLLYVGGAFTTADGQALANVAAWDGAQFVPAAINGLPEVYDLETGSGRLYAAADEVYRLGGGTWNQVGSVTLQTSVSARELAVVDGVPYAAGPWLTFCLVGDTLPCLAAARFVGGAWSLFAFDDFDPAFGGLSLESFDGLLYFSGALDLLSGSRFTKNGDLTDLNHLSPNSSAWYEATTLSLQAGCLDPGLPATLRIGDSPPLPVSVTSSSEATVDVPAGYLVDSGSVGAVLVQNGESAYLDNAYQVRPSLSALVYAFLVLEVEVKVATFAQAGLAWFVWSPTLFGPAIPLPGIHGGFSLDPVLAFAFGSLDLAGSHTFTLPYFPGQFPPGASIHVQALVFEQAQADAYLSLTNPALVQFP